MSHEFVYVSLCCIILLKFFLLKLNARARLVASGTLIDKELSLQKR